MDFLLTNNWGMLQERILVIFDSGMHYLQKSKQTSTKKNY